MINIRINIFYFLCCLLTLLYSDKVQAQQNVLDFSFYENKKLGPILMESTFYIYDPVNSKNAGTSFILAHVVYTDTLSKVPDSTYFNEEKKVRYSFPHFLYNEVFVTAAHILSNTEGDSINIVLRKKKG